MKNLYPLLFPDRAYAQSIIDCPDGTQADPEIGCVLPPEGIVSSETGLADLLLKLASGLMNMAIVAAILFLIYGGIQYALASGEEEKVQKAKRTIVWSIVGLSSALLARMITAWILQVI